ncbi:MAG: OmpA family protein [Bacteroidetes bacterium]|nr:OmpA family protein [Bacteroidota bacterium]
MRSVRIILVLAVMSALLSACVTKKQYNALDASLKKTEFEKTDCDTKLAQSRSANEKLNTQNGYLQSQVDDLKKQLDDAKKSNAQVLTTLQDMSVLSNRQAESVKQSLQSLGEKDNLINGLNSAMARKDSLNMALVMNLKGAIGDLGDKDINIKVDKSAVYIDISDKMLFSSGKSTVTDNAKVVLGKVAKVLDAYPDIEFLVEGHTDSVSVKTDCLDDNWDLSVKRATAVVRILQKQYGIQPSRMTAAGRGQYVPVDSNDNADGRAHNRRTRIVILPQMDQFFKLLVKK